MLDFIRIACAVPAVRIGDVKKNVQDICTYLAQADEQNVDILVFPELSVTGYSCGDLFLQDALIHAVERELETILTCSADHPALTAVIGLPVRTGSGLLNCAAVISGGEVRGLVSKQYLPDYDGFSESRWFTALDQPRQVTIGGRTVTVGTDALYRVGDTVVGIEICEDFFAPVAPSLLQSLNGAEIILNPAASPEHALRKQNRAEQVKVHSERCKCVYVYCSAGCTESTSDLVFSGHSIFAENGSVLAENDGAAASGYLLVQDCDLGRIRAERRRNATFRAAIRQFGGTMTVQAGNGSALRSDGALYPLKKLPFIPDNREDRLRYCRDMFQLQVTGLKQRLALLNTNAVIGISGGLDSTLALLVTVEAMRQLGRPVSDVYGVTMPCFGTSDRTYRNAWDLMQTLGIHAKEISIKNAVTGHFSDIGHDVAIHDGTYENSQARERTQILMDYASVVGGIVIGTGDLSELALGWCTYNGDHMSMYGVNGSVPKTLIRWIIEAVAEQDGFLAAKPVLADILDTPISPELLPPDAQGRIAQVTEDLVGPYALHDFFLYHVLRYGFAPEKVYALACRAFDGDFDAGTVKKWLRSFYRRFFTQQFKRNCLPDGVKAGPVSLSPRGDWQMPSDASARLWLEAVEAL